MTPKDGITPVNVLAVKSRFAGPQAPKTRKASAGALRDELEGSQIPGLRGGRGSSPKDTRRERGWDSRCYRISTINTLVHRHYRTLFEHIAAGKKYLGEGK